MFYSNDVWYWCDFDLPNKGEPVRSGNFLETLISHRCDFYREDQDLSEGRLGDWYGRNE